MSSAARPAVEGGAALTETGPTPSLARFLFAFAAATGGKVLMSLDCGSGGPGFHRLEPARQVVGRWMAYGVLL